MEIKEVLIEEERNFWINIAKANNWYVEPFYVQVWFNYNGDVEDSVSFKGIEGDIILDE